MDNGEGKDREKERKMKRRKKIGGKLKIGVFWGFLYIKYIIMLLVNDVMLLFNKNFSNNNIWVWSFIF